MASVFATSVPSTLMDRVSPFQVAVAVAVAVKIAPGVVFEAGEEVRGLLKRG
jgi:hypothetical protein